MLRANHFVGCLGVAMITLFGFGEAVQVAFAFNFPRDSVRVEVRTESTQPTGVPILLALTVTNISKDPIVYLTSAGQPPAKLHSFKARVTDSQGKARELELSNDSDGAFSGAIAQLQPGKSVVVPAVMEPLKAGTYTIEIWKGKAAQITVKDDPDLARKWDQDVLGRIRKGEQFALYVASQYVGGEEPRKSLIDGLLQQLPSDDCDVAYRAADVLGRVRRLPSGAGPIINKAITKQTALVLARTDGKDWVLSSLALLAAIVGNDDALESVLTLARTQQVRGTAIRALGSFKQETAMKELRLFLKDESEDLQFAAARTLAYRKDPEGLEALLVVAHDPKSRWRMYSFEALLKYPDDQRVEPAIKSGLQDMDSQVRQSAEFALRQLTNQKKQKP